MMRRHLPRLLALLLLGLASCTGGGAEQQAGCSVEKVTPVSLSVAGNFLIASVTINGHPARLLVDTGSETTILTPDAVERLGLAHVAARPNVIIGVGGRVSSEEALAREFRLGELTLRDQTIRVASIAHFPDFAQPVAGLLGTDILSRYDVEIDAPEREMTLWHLSGCSHYVPWQRRAASVPASLSATGRILVPVDVDRHEVRALLDSGARNSLITRRSANRAGVPNSAFAGDPVRLAHGIGVTGLTLRRHSFSTVSVGGVTTEDVPINVANTTLPGIEMLLGADWIADKRIWISFAEGRLFVRANSAIREGTAVASRR